MFVSQQAIAKGIASLEGILGAQVLERTKSGVRLTDFGRFFLERTHNALDVMDQLGTSLDDYRAGNLRTIKLGITPRCISDFGGTLNAKRLYALNKVYTGVIFKFEEVPGKEIEPLLHDGELQFAISAPLDDRVYENRLLANFPLVVLVSRQNPLSKKARISPADLATGTVTIPASDSLEPLLAKLGSSIGRTIAVSPIQVDSVDGANLVVSPSTFVIRPEQHARRTTSTEQVAIVPLADGEGRPLSVPLSIVWKRTLSIGEPERLLISYLSTPYANRANDDVDEGE